MKIVQLTAENLKRIKAIEIKPDGSLVQITGRNAQGKSSVLDAITYAIGGKDVICDRPIRDGSKKAKIVCELDDLTVTRTFTPGGGGTLTVVAKDGSKINSPQAALDALVGKLSFDPLAFTRMAPKVQAETLRALVGLDFTKIDAKRKDTYDLRTAKGRVVATLEAELKAVPHHADAPAAEVSVADLMAEFQAGQRHNDDLIRRQNDLQRDEQLHERRRLEVVEIQKELSRRIDAQAEHEKILKLRREELFPLKSVDVAPLEKQIAGSDAVNRMVRENQRRTQIAGALKAATVEVEKLTRTIEELDETKANNLASASFPIDGLSFDDSGVILNGIPFAQSSSAEQLRTSVAIGLASNPKLRVLLIRDGSLLDSEGLEMVAQMAEGYQAQVWIERVADGNPVGVVIEDGCVVESQVAATAK